VIVLAFKPRAEMTPDELEQVRAADRRREREAERSRRKHPVRATTENVTRLAKSKLQALTMLYPPDPAADERPRTRADCVDAPRPCPWAGCRHHLALDVNDLNGSIKRTFPDVEIEDMAETCALDVAERGDVTLEEVGAALNITRERVRQIEVRALAKALRRGLKLKQFVEEGATLTKPPRVHLHVVRSAQAVVESSPPDEDLDAELAVADEDLEP
jgi:sigma-70-like protein